MAHRMIWSYWNIHRIWKKYTQILMILSERDYRSYLHLKWYLGRRPGTRSSSEAVKSVSFFSLAFTRWCCLRYHISPRDPHFPASYPSSSDPESGPGGKERRREQRPRGAPGSGPASVVGLGDETLHKVESCGGSRLISRQSAFSPPLPHPGRGWGGLPSRPVLGRRLGPPGRAVHSPASAQPSVRRLWRVLRYVAAASGERHGPRGAVPLSPRAAAFCFSTRMRWPRGPRSSLAGLGAGR